MSLHQKIQKLIRNHADFTPVSNDQFDDIAKTLFAHQYSGIESYRNFCDRRGVTPEKVTSYFDVPSVPTDVFKHLRLCASSNSARVFRTSGTTTDARGEHHFSDLDTYRASIHAPFTRFVDADETPNVFVLAPPSDALPDSSLSWMLSELVGNRAKFFVNVDSDGVLQFEFDALSTELDAVAGPVTLLGTAFAFVTFFDETDRSWRLPEGSRLMETGGLKGRTREVSKEELYGLFQSRLGIAPEKCLAEYSMTELSSQAYTNALFDDVPWNESVFCPPPWARVDLLDPISMKPSARGLVRWFDLANVDSVCSILTSDIGERVGDGFVLKGRAAGAELRGCSLTIEEIVG